MFTIDIVLRNTPLPLSVQRKTAEEAEATYQQILAALNTGSPKVLELACDKQTDKKVGILSSEISAVQLADKSSAATSSGRPPGFLTLAE
jgi:hypothetical protein